ncbi:YjhX family toxin [Thalassococcus sp. BH17M4-6]|uniref:YjhX family toxin n=1 Tax=Thalassococcus sp. BH17M4-6 TaxID=3413148 RepID=UPI003BC9624E
MNISKHEQRVLHVLAQGGAIHFDRNPNGKVRDVTCFTRDGNVLTDCSLQVFDRLRTRRFVRSRGGQPYRITRAGLLAVRAQLDNR